MRLGWTWTRRHHPILIHHHIFKNAGSSLDRLLAGSFGPRWTSFDTSLHVHKMEITDLRRFLHTRPTIRAVSSHRPCRLMQMANSSPIVMLHRPIDRARSVFQFLRRDTSQEDHGVACGSFADYVAWALDTPGKGVAIRNFQVFYLSDAPLRRENVQMESTRGDLAQAQTTLECLPTFGMVRHFAASCRMFQSSYGHVFPELRLSDLRENASPDAAPTESDSISATRKELGERAFGRLCDANELDLGLYAFGRKLFEERGAASHR
jgi:hypothetical protein